MMSPIVTAPPNRNVAALVGRCAALCAHPYAAWRLRPVSARVGLVSTYAAAAYIVVLATLLVL